MTQTFPPRALDYGYPDMTQVNDADWESLFAAGREQHRAQIEEIAHDDSAATVEGVLRAYGRAGTLLDRVSRAFACVFSADATESRQDVYAVIAPERAAHEDWLNLHPGFNARLAQLQQSIDAGQVQVTAEQRWMLSQVQLKADVAGANLGQAPREQLVALNKEIAAQESAYQRLQNRELTERALWVQTVEELEGLSQAAIDSAASSARDAGHAEGYLLRLTMPVQQQALATLSHRQTRRRLHKASTARGSLPGEDGRTTYQIGAHIAVLRAKKARLLGYENFLESVLPLRTAPDRTAIENMLGTLAAGAAQRLRAEAAVIAAHLRLGDDLEPWDMSFGYEQAKPTAEHDGGGSWSFPVPLDEALRRVFDAAKRVYGLWVVEREDLPGFVEGARPFEVFSGAPGEPGTGIGLYILDVHTRATKSGGAWMNSFSVASELLDTRPVVINCLNVTPPAKGQQTLLSKGEHKTLFHEFGHALHGLLAAAEFPELSGTAVPRDNVEFPSQVNEVFQELYTGEVTPPGATPAEETLWGKGLSTVEHLAAVVIDLAWHTLSPEQAEQAAEDPRRFEQQVLADWGLDSPLVPPRYSSGFFKHIFASSGYAAGYYSYLWAEVLAEGASEWFRDALSGDASALRARGAHFSAELLSRGNTRDPLDSYRAAVGRDPDTEHLLRRLGLG